MTTLIDSAGLRNDGRKPNELRPIKMDVGILKNADGSAYIEMGKNKIIAAVYGPKEVHPRHLVRPDRAIVKCRYHMASFSTDTRKILHHRAGKLKSQRSSASPLSQHLF